MEYDRKLKGSRNGRRSATETLVRVTNNKHNQVSSFTIEEDDEEKESVEELGEIKKKMLTSKMNAKRGSCVRLDREEIAEVEVDAYLNEIQHLRRSIEQTDNVHEKITPPFALKSCFEHSGSGKSSENIPGKKDTVDLKLPESTISNLSKDPLAISIQATNYFYEFRRMKQQTFPGLPRTLQKLISFGHAFNQYPILDLEPVEFSRGNLIIPEKMKQQLGISSINSVQDLMTPEAQLYLDQQLASSSIYSGKNPRKACEVLKSNNGSFFYNFDVSRQQWKRRSPSPNYHQKNSAHHHQIMAGKLHPFTITGQKMGSLKIEKNRSLTSKPDEFEEARERLRGGNEYFS